ncbi:MAG TPA: radical SAM protein [Candidatus Dojkabacteria bacterium]|nr:radical SAM protein [Candidatus Dojkabacteria bacterium]
MKIISQEILCDDFFLISDDQRNLIFSPLRRIVFEVFDLGIKEIRKCQKDGTIESLLMERAVQEKKAMVNRVERPFKPMRLVLSLTSDCNLRCIYCYAEAGKLHKTMSWETAKSAIDETMRNLLEERKEKFQLTFHGGGEPFVAFKLMKKAVEYVNSKWKGKKDFSVVTNGTLITSEIADWLAEKDFRLTVSIDGPAEIQNRQRPKANGEGSYEDAISGAMLLKERGLKFGIRSTITNANVYHMEDLLKIAKDLDCSLKLEPFTPVGRGVDEEILSQDAYFKQFMLASKLAKEMGVPLKSTYSSGLDPKCIFCAGDGEMFCVLPDGKVSTCSRVTKGDDFLASTFIVGEINADGLNINPERVEELRHLNVMFYDQCRDCFAKWYCMGGCHNTRLLNDGVMPENHCVLEKAFLWTNLIKAVGSN